MRCDIVACGSSAKHWNGSGYSIGVNDSFKWGHKINDLIVVNHPGKFSNEPDRFKTIVESKPDRFISHTWMWKAHFPDMIKIHPSKYHVRIRQGNYYSSVTSPFVAISHAFNIGAKEIVLWGVDFIDHRYYKKGTKEQSREVDNYRRFIQALERHGVKCYLGADGSALNLPIWKNQNSG